MISPLYFKPSKRSAGGDLMISFVMEKCLILPMCACVQNTKKDEKEGKKLCVLWAITQLKSHSDNTCKEGRTKTYTYSFIFHVDCNYTQTKEEDVVLPQLQDFLLECAAMWQGVMALFSDMAFQQTFPHLSKLCWAWFSLFISISRNQINALPFSI